MSSFHRDDPAVFVERRFGLGYTINFVNPEAVAILCGFFRLVIVISVVAALTS